MMSGIMSTVLTVRIVVDCFPDAAVKFANYYSDGMVLQRDPDQAHIWGTGDSAGATVDIKVDGSATSQATVGSDRKWSANLPAMQAGGPHTIEVQSGGSSAMLSDVMFGDVWVCSGQSNMEFEFNKVGGFQVDELFIFNGLHMFGKKANELTASSSSSSSSTHAYNIFTKTSHNVPC